MTSGAEETVLGRITAVFGVRGWLKVHSYTDPIENIFAYKRWTLRHDSGREPVAVVGSKRHGKGLIVLLKGVGDRNQAQRYCGADIAVDSAELPVLPEGEYYWHQLEGLEVITDLGISLGVVDHLIETGANDVLVVRPSNAGEAGGATVDSRERLIPYLPGRVITDIDLENKRLTVVWDPEF